MATFVKFPGTAGNYVSTDDVNLLDADTAHIQQSVGKALNGNSVVSSSTDYPIFGANCLKAEMDGTGKRAVRYPTGVDGVPVSPSTEYTISVAMKTLETGWEGQVLVSWYDAAGALISSDNGSYSPIGSAYSRISVVATSPALAAFVGLNFYVQTGTAANPDSGDVVYLGELCLREGASAEFVPSLRVVGDLDMRALLAADDWTPAANQTIIGAVDVGAGGWRLNFTATGAMNFTAVGEIGNIAEATPSFTLVDGAATEVRVTLDVSAGDLVWYQDDVQVDTDTFTPQALGQGTLGMRVGVRSNGNDPFAGDFYWAEVRDGINGPLVARFDADDVPVP